MASELSPASASSPALSPAAGRPRFARFDGLRANAALLVVVYHVASVSGLADGSSAGDVALVAGNLGLLLFFAISGFLLYRPFVAAQAEGRRAPRIGRYLRNRALRILPAYWVALTVLVVWPGVVGASGGDWWRYYLLLQVYDAETLGGGIPQAWSLGVEATYYLLLPVLVLGVRRLPVRWLPAHTGLVVGLGAVGVLAQVLAARRLVPAPVAQALPGQLTWFALGMALAVVSVVVSHRPAACGPLVRLAGHPGWCWAGAAAAGVGLVVVVDPGGLYGLLVALRAEQPWGRIAAQVLLTGVFVALLVLPAVVRDTDGGLPRRVLAWAPLALLGVVSYGVYLWHLTVAQLLATTRSPAFSGQGLGLVDRLPDLQTPVIFVLTLAISVVLATLSYRLVELPFLGRKGG